MKITRIQTSNFLGARAVAVNLSAPVALFAGQNGAGKSSLQEAVRMALTGETVRVGMKKDYGALVSEGQDAGFVEVHTDDASYSVVLPAGKGMHADLPALPYVLDAQRFARLDPNERRAFLFGLTGIGINSKDIAERMAARGCDDSKASAVAPFLRAGFEAAQKEAQAKARECKAQWKTVTGGETYGSNKAATWAAKKPEVVDADKLEDARADLAKLDAEIETDTATLGAATERARQVAARDAKLADLRERAGRYARIADKLERDTASLSEMQAKVDDTRAKAGGAVLQAEPVLTCPHCAGSVIHVRGSLQAYEAPDAGAADPEAKAVLPEYERALTMLQNAVANGKRDLEAADAAAVALQALEDEESDAAADTNADDVRARIAVTKHTRANQAAAIRLLEEAERRASEADEKTAKAAALHADVQQWEAIADALAPDGIPGEMLAEALGPINERLATSALDAEWPRIEIQPDMTIFAALHERPYALLSESEKWRADAMIAEAIAHLSGVRLLVLDRFDVLDMKGREDLIAWLDIVAQDGEIDTALIFGTLKALPAQLPETVEAFWIESGIAGRMEVAA